MSDIQSSHESKQNFYSNTVTTLENLDDENIFDGEYEEYIEKSFYAEKNSETKLKPTNEFNSIVKSKRQQLFKIVITRPKREFESTYQFVDKGPGEENSGDIKNSLKNEFLTNDRAYLEIGLQTANDSNIKSYQVPKKITKNAFSQVEPGMKDVIDQIEYKRNLYFKNQNKLNDIENFLNKVRSMMEQALQSNETIDIFQNDFDLDRNTMIKTEEEKKDKDKIELRSFRDASAGPKIKKEKSVNYIRFLLPHKMYMAHSLLRNLSFEEKAKVLGIPCPSQILIWDLKNPEATAPIFFLEIPTEITCFEFCPTNLNKLVCGLYSGQLIFYEFNDLLEELEMAVDSDSINIRKGSKKDMYTFFITSIPVSHKTHVVDMKWFPINYSFHKLNLVKNTSNQQSILASMGEDGCVMLWDVINYDKTIKNDTNSYLRPILTTEVNKVDAFSNLNATNLELKVDEKNTMFYISTDEGQVYAVDWTLKITQENLTANVKKVYNSKYFRPILKLQFSPFYENIFLTLHDFHFSLWTVEKTKPIMISPNLKKSFYTFAKFSPSRPSVIYFTRNNGSVDIWDFLDESHKPSVKETIKENITFLENFRYYAINDEDEVSSKSAYLEYLAIGDYSGQVTLMEVSKLFSEKANEEDKLMKDILYNEINRQEYMEQRYRSLDDEHNKNDHDHGMGGDDTTNDSSEMKILEEEFNIDKLKILEELGLFVKKQEEDSTLNDY